MDEGKQPVNRQGGQIIMIAHGVRGRSWLVVFGVLGLVGSLLAVGAGPAGGVEGEG